MGLVMLGPYSDCDAREGLLHDQVTFSSADPNAEVTSRSTHIADPASGHRRMKATPIRRCCDRAAFYWSGS